MSRISASRRRELVGVMQEVLGNLRSASSDVAWSRYTDAAAAVADVSDHLARLETGDDSRLGELRVLFAPTGAVQEISIGSGWGEEFLDLAARFDRATAPGDGGSVG